MTTILLHHYPTSPFAELVRMAMGVKQLAWGSVTIPTMLPKPDLVELTGGYARTPVLQIGADLYCDTAAIIDAIDVAAPQPALYPAPLGSLHRMIAGWAGAAQFAAHVGAAMRNMPAEALPPGFAADRKARFVGFDFDTMPLVAPHLETQVLASVAWLSTALGDGRSFIGGDQIGHGDLALYSNLWFIRSMPFAADFAAPLFADPVLAPWFDRVASIGHGQSTETTADEAIAVARAATPMPVSGIIDSGMSAGQSVQIRTEHSGDPPVKGRLLRCDNTGISIARTSDRAGEVNVHFPRIGQIVVSD